MLCAGWFLCARCRRQGAASTVMMPIGVPKVAYRVPGAQTADWVDIYNRLYREVSSSTYID
jgi:hypothetical protein